MRYNIAMKTLLLTLFSVFILSSCSSQSDWIHDYDQALILAKEQEKDVYLFIGADVCKHCDNFKKWTLSKTEVMERLKEDYIPVYLSRDQHKIPAHFKKQGVPRHYFLTSDGSIIHADQGSREPDGFFSILDEVDLKKDD